MSSNDVLIAVQLGVLLLVVLALAVGRSDAER
jgi:hypothetical protein